MQHLNAVRSCLNIFGETERNIMTLLDADIFFFKPLESGTCLRMRMVLYRVALERRRALNEELEGGKHFTDELR